MDFSILGTKEREVELPSSLKRATNKTITFCSLKDAAAIDLIDKTQAAVVICSDSLSYPQHVYQSKTLIAVANPRLAFINVMNSFFSSKVKYGIHPTAIIEKEAQIHPDVYIGPYCNIEKCVIGKNAVIHGSVHIGANTIIGENVVIGPGTVICKEGFGYERSENGDYLKFPHIGGVLIENNVEIGANVVIDRGTMDNTVIGKGTKIDNLCHIAHNVVIGKNCLIIAMSIISGSVTIGDNCWISPQSCIRNGISIGNNVTVGMGAVVTKDVGDGQTVFGIPAKERK